MRNLWLGTCIGYAIVYSNSMTTTPSSVYIECVAEMFDVPVTAVWFVMQEGNAAIEYPYVLFSPEGSPKLKTPDWWDAGDSVGAWVMDEERYLEESSVSPLDYDYQGWVSDIDPDDGTITLGWS